MKSNDYDNAAIHFVRSISWYVPYADYVDDSAKNMINIAKHYEEKGQDEEAQYIYNILRGAILSVRSTYFPGEIYLKTCNEKIAELDTKSIEKTDEIQYSKKKEELLGLLNEKGESGMIWSSVSSLSFIGWVFMAVVLIMHLFKNNTVNLNNNVIIILSLFAIFYVVWLMSLIKA
jgi:hypothetical protein